MGIGLSLRIVLVILGVAQEILCCGLAFGWVPFERVLIRDGYFSAHCPGGTASEECASRAKRLNLTFTIASFSLTGANLFAGLVMDRYGPGVASRCGSVFFTVGVALLSRADPKSVHGDLVLIVGFALASFAGPFMHLTLFHLSNLFPAREGTVINLFVGSFISSSLVFLALYYMGLTVTSFFTGYLAVAAAAVMLAAVVWPSRSLARGDSVTLGWTGSIPRVVIVSHADTAVHYDSSPAKCIDGDSSRNVQSKPRGPSSQYKTLRDCVFSPAFAGAVAFMSLNLLRMRYLQGTFSRQLAHHTPDGNPDPPLHGINGGYIIMFSWIAGFGCLFVPLSSRIVEALPTWASFVIANTLGVAYGSTALLPSLKAQIATMLLWAASNQFLFGVTFSFIAREFGFRYYGILIGILQEFSAGVSLFQHPLATTAYDGHFVEVNVGLLGVGVLLYTQSAAQFIREKRRDSDPKLPLLAS